MRSKHPKRVENFTVPFLVSFYVLVLMGLITIWATTDFLIALIVAFGVHIALARRLTRRETG